MEPSPDQGTGGSPALTIQHSLEFPRKTLRAVWFWYRLDDPLGPVYDMAAHTNDHYLQLVNVRFPDLPDGKVYRGEPVTRAFAKRSHAEGWWRTPHAGESGPPGDFDGAAWASLDCKR